MTTSVTISAKHGWPVQVQVIDPKSGAILNTQVVLAGDTRNFHVHSTADLRIHEVQRSEGDAPLTHLGLPVAGYQPQTDANVARVNGNKQDEERILRKLDALKEDPAVDQRWLAIGRTAIEQGFMAVNRAVFRPGRVELDE